MTASDLEEWRRGEKERFSYSPGNKRWFQQFGTVIDKYKTSIYKYKPFISDMRVTPSGNILLARTGEGEKPNGFWLIDAKGKTLVQISLDIYQLTISKRCLFFKKADEDGAAEVHCFVRTGSGIEDLTILEKALK